MKKQFYKKVIQSFAFIILLFVLLQLGSYIFLPKWWKKDYNNAIGSLVVKGFYEEKKNSLDMIFLGSSSVFCGISPMILWENYGITSYVLSTSEQRLITSYYLLEESLHYQTPKVVVLDMNEVFATYQVSPNYIRKTYDNIKLGITKMQAITDPNYRYNPQDILSYLFPIFRYHTRWNGLEETDLDFEKFDFHNFAKGVYMSYRTTPYEINLNYMNQKDYSKKIDSSALTYLNKIINLCQQKNIKLILMDMPQPPTWTQTKHNLVKQFADEHQLDFIDFNLINYGIDWNIDLKDDGYHFNLYGAEKTTSYLGTYLMSNYSFANHKQNPYYDIWHTDATQYEELKKELLLQKK